MPEKKLEIKEKFLAFWEKHPKVKKTIGVLLLIIGIISIITPFTPFGFVGLLGLELLGLREAVWEKFKPWFKK